MFYCEKCRKKNKWPESGMGSHGRCEVCGKTADCHDTPSSVLPDPPKPKKGKTPKSKLTPVDEAQCQCERPNGANFMTLGMAPGLVRCRNTPIVLATEAEATHEDGERGSMALCGHCMNRLIDQMGYEAVTFRAIEREGDDKGV